MNAPSAARHPPPGLARLEIPAAAAAAGERAGGRSRRRRRQRSTRGPSNSERRARQGALGDPPPSAHAGGGGGRDAALRGGPGWAGRGGKRCLLTLSDRRRRGHRLTEHTLLLAGWREAGGAPATVTGTNKEVFCARAAAPSSPRPPPRPAAPAPSPAPGPRPRAPPPGPRSDARSRAGVALGGVSPRPRVAPEAVTPASSLLERFARRGTKKSCARSFLAQCGCRKRGPESRLLLRGPRARRQGHGAAPAAAARSRPGARACSCPLAGCGPHSLSGRSPPLEG